MPFALVVLDKMGHEICAYDVARGDRLARAATAPFPHELCLDPQRRQLFVTEYGVQGVEVPGRGGNTIGVYRAAGLVRTGTISTGEHERPHGVVADGDGRLYVTAEASGSLLIFERATGTRLFCVATGGSLPHLAACAPDDATVYTANVGSATLTEIDAATGVVRGHVDVLTRPEGMAFSPDGALLYVVNRESAAVAIVDTARRTMIDAIATGGGPVRLVITPDGRTLAFPLFHDDAVQIADTSSRSIVATIPVGRQPAGIALSPDGRLVFVSCEHEGRIYAIDLQTRAIVHTIAAGQGPDAMVCLWREELSIT
jgi:YVTN family beta-propeller protein